MLQLTRILVILLLQAQVQSSDATKNIPFHLRGNDSKGHAVPFQGNRDFVTSPSSPPGTPSAPHLVQIKKSEIASVEIGKYTLTEEVQYMPLVSCVSFDCFRAGSFYASLILSFHIHS